ASALQRACGSGTVAHRQGFAGWHHGQISGHHAPVVKFFAAHDSWSLTSGAKTIYWNSRDPLTDSVVHGGPTQVGITVSGAKRGEAPEATAGPVVDIDVRDVDHVNGVEAGAIAPVPRVEAVTRSDRQPAHRTESKTKSHAAAKAEERHIGGCPHRAVSRIAIDRTGPPHPGAVVH